MADTQLENGYTQIANELIEAMASHDFGGSKGQVFSAIIRLTYGWHKKADKISISRICDLTRLSKRSVIYALQNLEAQNKVSIGRNVLNHVKQINEISIQKDYDKWDDNSFAPQYQKLKAQAKIRSAKLRKCSAKLNEMTEGSAKLGKKVVQNSVKKVNSFAHTKERKIITKEKGPVAVENNPENIYDFFAEAWLFVYKKKAPRNIIDEGAIIRLSEAYGVKTVCGLMAWAEKNRANNKYIALITKPRDLEDKWNSLSNQFHRKEGEKKNVDKYKI